MNTRSTPRDHVALTVAYVGGLTGVVALPAWFVTLMQHYQYLPSQAGLTVGLFFAGLVFSSLVCQLGLTRWPGQRVAAAGFALAALVFLIAGFPAVTHEPGSMKEPTRMILTGLHPLAGLGMGAGLTFTLGAFARVSDPQRLFGWATFWLTVCSVLLLAAVPSLLVAYGPPTMFLLLAALSACSALASWWHLRHGNTASTSASTAPSSAWWLRPSAWWGVGAGAGAVFVLCLVHAMVFNHVEKISSVRGFFAEDVDRMLVAMGPLNLLPCLLALWWRRLSATLVGIVGLLGLAVLGIVSSNATVFGPFAVATGLSVFVMVFTLNFLFGIIARADPVGHAVAALPVLLICGAGSGIVLGSLAVGKLGYASLGWVALVLSGAAAYALWRADRARTGSGNPASSAQRPQGQPLADRPA